MPILIGCSGWQYKDWRESFYAKGVAQKRWLEFYAERFQTVEVNNSFYRLPKPETFAGWAERTPEDFILTVKMSRYLTHIKRLKEPDEPVERFMSHAQRLGKKIGPVLLQLPPNLKADHENLLRTLELLAEHHVRVTVEFRHESWWTDQTESVLRKTGAALTWADRMGEPIGKLWRTTDWGYLRLHEGAGPPHPCYDEETLGTWARRVAESFAPEEDVYVYFNNDPNACAVRDAVVFAEACSSLGLEPTRVPQPDEVHPWGEPVPNWPSWFRR